MPKGIKKAQARVNSVQQNCMRRHTVLQDITGAMLRHGFFLMYGGWCDVTMARGKKLDDKTREAIRAHYASCGNMNGTAKEFGVSWSTVKNICDESDGIEKLREHKKTEWVNEAWKAINLYMQHVQKPDVVERTNARDSAILMGTLHDKMIKSEELAIKREELDIRRKEQEEKSKGPDAPNISVYVNALKDENVWDEDE